MIATINLLEFFIIIVYIAIHWGKNLLHTCWNLYIVLYYLLLWTRNSLSLGWWYVPKMIIFSLIFGVIFKRFNFLVYSLAFSWYWMLKAKRIKPSQIKVETIKKLEEIWINWEKYEEFPKQGKRRGTKSMPCTTQRLMSCAALKHR